MSNADRLRDLIAKTIEEDPYAFEGFQWAARSQAEWCARLGFAPATLRRMIAQPPFVRDCIHVGSRKVTLLREGEPGPMTARHIANTMSYIWCERFNRRVSRSHWGCLKGLAETWPDGHQVEIFKATLDNWSGFMVGVKGVIAVEGGKVLYLEYPSIATMRKYHKVGVELYVMRLQEQGKFSVQMQDKYLPLMA